jgi:hypothetical protein
MEFILCEVQGQVVYVPYAGRRLNGKTDDPHAFVTEIIIYRYRYMYDASNQRCSYRYCIYPMAPEIEIDHLR